jgi:hypothetical protein
MQRGGVIGFSPAAMVWHHRRNSVSMYWKQQCGYGRAEAWLEQKWPEKYNAVGHVSWAGRLYGKGLLHALSARQRIYHGTWGSALFQSVYQVAPSLWASLPLMPEWYLLIGGLLTLSAIGLVWTPLLAVALPPTVVAIGALVAQAMLGAMRASFTSVAEHPDELWRLRALTAGLYLMQPVARLWGRLRHGLTPWKSCPSGMTWPVAATSTLWSERWTAPEQRLQALESLMRAERAVVLRGGNFDGWDLEVRGGILGRARVRMTIEEHGGGRQLVRWRVWPRLSRYGRIPFVVFSMLTVGAMADGVGPAAGLLGVCTLVIAAKLLHECGAAMAIVVQAMRRLPLRSA